MKRKLILLLALYLSISFVLTTVQSCDGFLSYDAKICDISFKGLNQTYNESPTDTLTRGIVFYVSALPGSKCYRAPDLNLLSTCYATKKCAKWKNTLLEHTFQLSFDKKLMLNGDSIPAKTNLLLVQLFKEGIEISKNDYECSFIQYKIKFSEDLVSKINFEQGIYTVSFSCETSDRQSFVKDRQVIIKL